MQPQDPTPTTLQKLTTTLTLTLLFTLTTPHATADFLTWSNTSADLTPSPTDTQAVATFTFTNTADQPVTIASVTPSCGCTSAVPDKSTYQPGETGTITATLPITPETERRA